MDASSTRPSTWTRPTTSAFPRPSTTQSRPGTKHSRPATTTRPLTAASSRHEGSFVVALLEARGIGREVGIAALDKDTGHVVLIQLADCQTYVKTLHHLHLHYPSTILVPDTFLASGDVAVALSGRRPTNTSILVQCLQEEFPGVPLEPILRKYWNEGSGLHFIDQLCVDDEERAATILAVSNKYYALSAACALFKHAELRLNTRFAANSLRIRYTPVEGTMLIDTESARNLELVGNMTNRKSNHSLFGVLNHTWTAMAARLLRVNLLAPITAPHALSARLDAVEELVQNEDKFTAIKDGLRTVNKLDLDKLIASLIASEANETISAKPASQRVAQMLNLRSVVRNIPTVQDAVKCSSSRLLQVICEMISDERIAKIENLISESLNEDASPQKGGGLNSVNSRVYAVKANCNRLLDVARETYKENVGDIFELNRSLCDEHDLPLQLIYQESGFVFTLKKSDLETSGRENLPPGLVNVTIRKGKYFFESMELKKRNARMKDALDETLMLSDRIVQDLVSQILTQVGALYKASEAIALLDMLWSFAHAAILRNYVRPEFTGTLAIKGGRHPILQTVQSSGTLVANDVYCCDASSFQIIQGPNMSGQWKFMEAQTRPLKKWAGKSTYLRQTGLLTVMAMCGSFVPAEYASFRIHDSLLTRLSNDDDIERNLSTFANEMSTSAMILGLATSQSLVIMDELGRGTSPREGVGISHAIAEALIQIKCFVFFATHFNELAMTLSRQPSIVNLHLAVQTSRPSESNIGITFQYKIIDGVPNEIEHYGLQLARLADLPPDVLSEAHRVATRLECIEATRHEESNGSKIALRRKILLRLRTQLTQTLEHSTLPDSELAAYIARIQKDTAQAIRETLSHRDDV
ncbi:hypothetical protein BD410DRAFT_748498 [Rickenella mellea]|uniref:DNA mismatch repair proteins mutS family domain-containing protein n=1 Tax=Rickenella mellea TaxID=50990 RepID=A0A4Y7Q5V6_9AGAM|nr:hypothetical protein BD410DRAFT_748498 [Rickenella mellea]